MQFKTDAVSGTARFNCVVMTTGALACLKKVLGIGRSSSNSESSQDGLYEGLSANHSSGFIRA